MGHDQKISKKVFSLFLSPPCRETPENARKTFLKKNKKEKKAGRYFFEGPRGRSTWVCDFFFTALFTCTGRCRLPHTPAAGLGVATAGVQLAHQPQGRSAPRCLLSCFLRSQQCRCYRRCVAVVGGGGGSAACCGIPPAIPRSFRRWRERENAL